MKSWSRSSSGRPIVRSVVLRIATRSHSRCGLLESMRRQEDRGAALAEPVDQLVDATRGDRVETGRRLVEEQDLRVAEERSRERDPLAKALGQGAARIVRPVGEVDGLEGTRDARARIGHLVQVGEALEVLEDAQAQVQPRRLGHDRDPAPDLDAVLGRQRDPGHRRRARGRFDQRAERPHRRRLAGTVRPEEAEDLAASDLERDVVERAAVAEGLGEAADRQRWISVGHDVRTVMPPSSVR